MNTPGVGGAQTVVGSCGMDAWMRMCCWSCWPWDADAAAEGWCCVVSLAVCGRLTQRRWWCAALRSVRAAASAGTRLRLQPRAAGAPANGTRWTARMFFFLRHHYRQHNAINCTHICALMYEVRRFYSSGWAYIEDRTFVLHCPIFNLRIGF